MSVSIASNNGSGRFPSRTLGKFLIDTCSLVFLAHRFRRLDARGDLAPWITEQLKRHRWLLLGTVLGEAELVADGVVGRNTPFIISAEPWKEGNGNTSVIPDEWQPKIDTWRNERRAVLGSDEYEAAKSAIWESADFRLLFIALRHKPRYTIVTEENAHTDDGKMFQKIPSICAMEGIPCMTMAEHLARNGFRLRPSRPAAPLPALARI